MKLDEDLKDNLRSYINNIIADYSEKDFDIEKFLQFLFALYEQSDSLDDFSDLCQKELIDFFADNTENFVNDVMTHLNMNLETFNEVDRRNSRVSNDNNKNNADSISQPPSERADDDNEASDDDLLNDDDDEESDMNYKRRKMKSPSDTDEQPQKTEPTNAPKQHSHHRQHNTEHNKKENNHKYQKNPQHNKNKPFPQGPPPQMPGGMMPQPNMPNMPNMSNMPPQMMPPGGKAPPMMPDQKWPWPTPYPYMYPMGYMPNMPNMPTMPSMSNMPNMSNMPGGYPPPGYPDPMGMMYPPPQYMMPEGKPSDYDPLHPEIKNPSKMDVKPPSSKPPESQHSRKHQPRRDEQAEAPQPSKIHVGDKDGKRTPRTAPQQQRQQPQSHNKPAHGQGGHGGHGGQGGQGGNAPSAAEGGNPKTTVYVKNIPDYYNNLDALNKQLKKFGPIVNIKVDLKTKSAMIEFVKPKHARTALSSKAPLFGNKEILLSGDMEAMNEDTNKEAKFDGQLLEKLKFLIEIKKYTSEEGKKMIVQKINDIKQAQKTKEIPDNLKKLLEYPIFDANTDFSQVIENVPDQYIAEKNKLSNKLETYGKLENFKLNPKTKTLEFKFYNLENASKAQQALATEFQIKYVNDKVHEIVDKITDFEQNYLSGSPDDHPL